MRVLFISNGDPFGVGGGAFGSRAFLMAFSEISEGNIDLCIADNCRENDGAIALDNIYRVKPRSFIRRVFSVFTGELHRYTSFVKDLLRNNPNRYDLCVLNNSLLCYTIVPILKKYKIKIVVIHHNFEREFFRDNTPNPIKRALLVPIYIKSERRGYLNSNLNLFHTNDDLLNCEKFYGKTTAVNKTWGVFEFKSNKTSKSCKQMFNINRTYIVTGSMNNPQGEDSVKYFLKELYPELPTGVRVIISGQKPSSEIIELCSAYQNVKLIPNPQDMNEVIVQGDVYICPTRVGGGLKVRIMDGLKNGLPAIVHKCSSRGYDMFFGSPYFRVFFDAKSFKQAIADVDTLLSNNEVSPENIIQKYNEYFSFEAGKQRLADFMKEI